MLEGIAITVIILAALIATALFVAIVFRFLNSSSFRQAVQKVAKVFGLTREPENPILSKGHYSWESESVMNPAAVEAGGRVHLFYRAVGADGVSRVGYASSPDGVTFDDRLPYPVFALDNHLADRRYMAEHYPELLASGGSWAGVEDPRAVIIDGKLYLSFSAFGGWDSLRIGVVSLPVDDLIHKRWNWSQPAFLSAPGEVHKSWVLFPEKINGKFAVLHGFNRENRDRANIAYLDSLDRDPVSYIKSDASFRDELSETEWDTKVRGAGPPPVKTNEGWLLVYHANEAKEMHRYKLGALLLDLTNPARVIARTPEAILSPDAHYENDGKPGIVYACGAILQKNLLRVYYGGADKVICSAAVKLSEFLSKLVQVPQYQIAPAM